MLDFYFYYKNIARYILFLKKSEKKFNFTDILEIKKSIIFFDLKNIIDLNNLSISNYYFFFKFFFGKIPFFTSYKYNFKLNVNYYNFVISYNLVKKGIYYALFFFINDIYILISKNVINIKKELNFWEFSISDMNFFVEKKNSIGFFNLKDHVNFKFIFNNESWLNFFNFFSIFKL
jgi:hypothetical protein